VLYAKRPFGGPKAVLAYPALIGVTDMTTSDDPELDINMSFGEQIAEAMAIQAGSTDTNAFIPQAEQLLQSFEAIEGRAPADYLEIEEWSMRRARGSVLVVK
jgi:hypothetical protein